jgi:hypothetical protein
MASLLWSPGPRPSPVFRSAVCDCLSLNVSVSLIQPTPRCFCSRFIPCRPRGRWGPRHSRSRTVGCWGWMTARRPGSSSRTASWISSGSGTSRTRRSSRTSRCVKCHLDSHLTGRGHPSALHPAVRGRIFPSALSSPVRPCAITTVVTKRARLAGLRAAAQHAGRAHAPRAGGAALRAGSAPVPTRSPQRPGPACYGIDDVFDRCHAPRGSLIGGAGGGGGARQARVRRPRAAAAPARNRLQPQGHGPGATLSQSR